MSKSMRAIVALVAHPIAAAAAQRAQAREETISRIAFAVGDRGEAQRAVELAERVGLDASVVYSIAARGEPLPRTEAELRATVEVGRRRHGGHGAHPGAPMSPPEWHRVSTERWEFRAGADVLVTVTREEAGWVASDGVRGVRRYGRDEAMLVAEGLVMREVRR